MPTLYPIGYDTEYVDLPTLIKRELVGMEPEAARRHIVYIQHMDGMIGIGDGWRPTPSGTSPASIRGESFHQTQTFFDGTKAWTAIDYVRASKPGSKHVTCRTGDLPVQGSAKAKLWGIHANVGEPGQKGWEPWHGQPIEHDGWATWVSQGRKRPVMGYPLPGHVDTGQPIGDDMKAIRYRIPNVKVLGNEPKLIKLGVPTGAVNAVIRISLADHPPGPGWVDAWSADDYWKGTAVVNYHPGLIDGGTTLVGVNAGGNCFVMASSDVALNIDVQGWS